MRNKRLVCWKNEENCKKYHTRDPYSDRPEWYVDGLVEKGMLFGDHITLKEGSVKEFTDKYDCIVY